MRRDLLALTDDDLAAISNRGTVKRALKELDVNRSEVARHFAETGHRIDMSGLKVLECEPNWRRRIVKEAIWTKKLGSSNQVKHDIGHTWRV